MGKFYYGEFNGEKLYIDGKPVVIEGHKNLRLYANQADGIWHIRFASCGVLLCTGNVGENLTNVIKLARNRLGNRRNSTAEWLNKFVR